MSEFEIINPKAWKAPQGYSNAVKVTGGRTLYLGGQVAFNEKLEVVGEGDLVKQFEQVMKNLETVMKSAGGFLNQIVKLTIFVQDRDDYIANAKEIGRIYRYYFGKHYPAMTLVEVARFFEKEVLLEIEGIAILD